MNDGVGHIHPVAVQRQAPQEFSLDAQDVDVRTIPLDNARTNEAFQFGAKTFMWAVDASDLNASVEVKFNHQGPTGVTFKQGMAISGIAFNTVYISHAAQSGKTITLVTINSRGRELIEVINASSAASSVTPTKATVFDTAADVSIAAASTGIPLAANANRREAFLSNTDAAIDVRVGDSNVGAARGIVLKAGQSMVLETTEEIRVHNPGASAVTLALAWTED